MQKDSILGRPIRLNKQSLAVVNGRAKVLFLGDIHLGHPQCDEPRLKRAIEYAYNNDIYVLLMGDLIEMATRESVGSGVYDQQFPGQTQYERIVEYLRPLAKKGAILGSLQGNHEERVYKMSGVNVSKMLCRELNIPYLGDACWNRFKVGSQSYTLYTMHGRSGARFDGTALLAAERIANSFFCDIFAMGHIHKCIDDLIKMQRVENGLVKEHKKLILITGSYMQYDDTYAQTMGLPISKLGSPQLTLYADKKDFSVNWD